MTFSELKTEIWEALGSPTDLDPSSYTQIADWINRGYKRICYWKLPNGRRLRFRAMEGEVFFQTVLKTGTAEDGAAGSVTLENGQVGASDDQYNGWVVEITGGTGSGQKRLIADYVGGTRVASVASDWTTNPDSTSTYELYKQFMKFATTGTEDLVLDPNDRIFDVLKVFDLEDENELGRGDRTTGYSGNLTTPGTPSEYIVYGDRLEFDCPIDEARWYKLWYTRMPTDLSADSDEPEIPEPWQEPIVLWAIWKGLQRQQEAPLAYAAKRNLIDMIQSLVPQYSMDDEKEESFAVIDYGD